MLTRTWTDQAVAELAQGERVGPYTVEAPCGQGGMAWVYKAVGPDGEVVALKLVRPELAVEDMFPAALLPRG